MAVEEVGVEALRAALADGARLIDVREEREYVSGHIAGSVLIPLATVPDHVDDFRGERPTYVICRVGARSMRACEFLEQQGVAAINVAGGMLAWADLGQPVEQGPALGSGPV